MMKKVFAAILSIALIAGVSACGEKKAEGPDYADDEAMSIIAEGFSKRSSLIDKLKGQGKDTSESKNLQQIVQAEIDNDKPMKARQFKDSKLQEQIIAYLNSLDDQLSVVKKYSNTSAEYTNAWNEVYDLSLIHISIRRKYRIPRGCLRVLLTRQSSFRNCGDRGFLLGSTLSSAGYNRTVRLVKTVWRV